jgi:hypothetical protein
MPQGTGFVVVVLEVVKGTVVGKGIDRAILNVVRNLVANAIYGFGAG